MAHYSLLLLLVSLSALVVARQQYRVRRGVVVARRRVRRPGAGGQETTTGEGRGQPEEGREGRHLELVEGILLKLQCLDLGCQSQPTRASFCCHHNVNIACCAYTGYLGSLEPWQPIFSPVPVYRPHYPTPPAIVPAYHHSQQEEHHHHQSHHQGQPHHQQEEDYHHQAHSHIFEGSLRPVHLRKAGSCPAQDSGYWQSRSRSPGWPDTSSGGWPDTIFHSLAPGPDCSHDDDCSGEKKCCHTRVAQHRLVMTCRLPEEVYGAGPYWREGKGTALDTI